MTFNLEETLELLSRTPAVLNALLSGLADNWIKHNEGGETWNPYDVVGHLIVAERTNWLPRTKMILHEGESCSFEPFNRVAMFETSQGKALEELLEEFSRLREQNLQTLRAFNLTEDDFEKIGHHPDLGKVTLRQLLATWVVHDLSHLRQIVRTMAKQYETEVGPWKTYLSIFSESQK
jgi:hypothetical protein